MPASQLSVSIECHFHRKFEPSDQQPSKPHTYLSPPPSTPFCHHTPWGPLCWLLDRTTITATGGYGVLPTGCISGLCNGYGTQQSLTPGMPGVSLANSPLSMDLACKTGLQATAWDLPYALMRARRTEEACMCVCVLAICSMATLPNLFYSPVTAACPTIPYICLAQCSATYAQLHTGQWTERISYWVTPEQAQHLSGEWQYSL